ncbi:MECHANOSENSITIVE ION CHANNEL PROTEIN 5 [Salix purpurea]|uniref:Mechanosensitive ion channel protein n=1 Tax=Salix purpurea TaxID=77065 RepID=A0A9Q0VUU3_SALPP|nr:MECHANOSENSITIVE ION CHANNEL PROTEIN 5 [Salix purpurea]
MALNSTDRKDMISSMDELCHEGVDVGSNNSSTGSGGGRIWRESSYDLLNNANIKDKRPLMNGDNNSTNTNASRSCKFDFNGHQNSNSGVTASASDSGSVMEEEDPPSKLIGHFLHKQQASGEFCLDMDLEMMTHLQNDTVVPHKNLPPVTESPLIYTNRVSLDPNPPGSGESVRRRRDFKNSSPRNQNNGDAEILRCSSSNDGLICRNSPFKRNSSLSKERTKSRLMDPPPEKSGRVVVGRSGQLKSGFLGKGSVVDEEEDDPLLEEDLPDEYKKDELDFWILLEWTSLIVIIAALVCSLAIPFLRAKNFWRLRLWKWEVLVLVLICGRLVSGWAIKIIVFFIERNFLLRKRVLYFVYGIRKAVQNCLWLGLVLIAWHYLFDKKIERETRSTTLRFVTKVLVCLVVGTLLWLVKTLVVKVLASSFHVSTYFDRIQESLFNQYVIETLSGPPLVEMQRNEEGKESAGGGAVPPGLKATASPSPPQSAKVIGSGGFQKTPRIGTPKLSRALSNKIDEEGEGITIDHLHKLNPKNVSAWNMKRLMNIIRHGALSTLDEQIQNSNHGDEESATKIRSEFEARAAARNIFTNVARQGSRYIYLDDIMRFMQKDEASKVTSLIDGASESNKISKKCLKNWVVNAFRERRALALTLNDTKTAVNKLHRMVNFLVGIIIAVIWLLILGIATSKFLLFLSSQLLLVAFIFGNTCKAVFESIIFLFVIHPFDVGDRCEIDGVQMVVEEMNILTTVFLRCDNQKIIITNSVLATKAIGNYYRSPDMGDAVEFLIHLATPAEKIAIVKQRISSYIESKRDHWYPSPMIIFKDVEDLTRVRVAVWVTHRMNHQDMGERFVRRSLLLDEMMKIFRELDIQYRLLPLDINVRALPPVMSDRLPAQLDHLKDETKTK